MKLQESCGLVPGLLLVAGLICCADKPGPVVEKDTRPAKPDSAVIAAWKKAGAEFGWYDVDERWGIALQANRKSKPSGRHAGRVIQDVSRKGGNDGYT